MICYCLFRYLGEKLLSEFRPCAVKIRHVQGGEVDGMCVRGGHQVIILAMMRGGDPMARGVFDVFPRATYVHYVDKQTALPDLGDRVVVVVDSVINSGRSIRAVLNRLKGKCRRVFVLAGVTHRGASAVLPVEFPTVRFYSLRISENSYVGNGATDTGDRLFGTSL